MNASLSHSCCSLSRTAYVLGEDGHAEKFRSGYWQATLQQWASRSFPLPSLTNGGGWLHTKLIEFNLAGGPICSAHFHGFTVLRCFQATYSTGNLIPALGKFEYLQESACLKCGSSICSFPIFLVQNVTSLTHWWNSTTAQVSSV